MKARSTLVAALFAAELAGLGGLFYGSNLVAAGLRPNLDPTCQLGHMQIELDLTYDEGFGLANNFATRQICDRFYPEPPLVWTPPPGDPVVWATP